MLYANGDIIYEQDWGLSFVSASAAIRHAIVRTLREFPGQHVFVDCRETFWYPRYAFWDLTQLAHTLTNTPGRPITPCVKVWLHRYPRWHITYGHLCLTQGDVLSSR